MATLTIHHYLDIIKSFINDVETSRHSYYLFFGKPDPWLNSSGGNDDVNVTTNHVANDSVYQHESSIYHDIIFGKIITPSDIEYMIPRYDWVSNTVYDQYDQFTMDVFTDHFYVLTDEFNVFKVIDNNNYAPSTIKPALTSGISTFQTSDGYIWKFMYNVGSAANLAFTTASFIPVTPNTAVSANSTNGTIDAIRLVNGGNGYPYYTGYLSSSVDNKTLIIDNGASYSNNFYTKSSIYLKDGYGAGQIRQIQKYDGLNKIVTVDTSFDNYGVFNISGINNPASFVVGNILTQNIDSIATVYNKGIFRINDVLVQSDTGANGQIILANSTIVKVIKGQGSNAFSLDYPIYNTSQSANLASGKITVTPFTELNVASNTGAFTVGEYIYQANATSNTANGIVANVSYTQITDLTITSNTGAFTVGEWIYQNDGSANTANGIVYSVNTSLIKVTNVTGTFVSNSTVNNVRGNTSSSNAKITTITDLRISSNTGVFTVGEYIYQSNGSANTANGVVYSVNTTVIKVTNVSGVFVSNATANNVKGNTSTSNAVLTTIAVNNSLTIAANNFVNLRVGITTGTFVVNSTANSIKGNTSTSNATIKTVSSNNSGNNYLYSTNTAQTSFTTQFLVGDYVRVGENANLNIRRVTSVNSSVIVTDAAINSAISIVSANIYNVPYVLEASSVTLTKAHGVISNVNIYGVKITYSDKTNLAINFTPGEKVDLVDSSNTTQGVYGIVSYSNTTTTILTGVTGGNGFQSTLGGTLYTDLTISSNTGVFNVGEWVFQSNGSSNTANGIVSSVNSSVIRVGTVGGVFVANYSTQQIQGNTSGANAVVTYVNSNTVGGSSAYMRGESSLQRGKIDIIDSYPNVTVYDPTGEFLTGIQVNTRDPASGGVLGYANVISFYITPNQLTEYAISPTVTITGDGANSLAYSIVDTSDTSTGALTNIIMLNPGHNYTYANVVIVSNNFFSNGANATAVVSPVYGHGYDAYSELGAKYAGISMTVANGMSESYKFPVYGKYRRIGIIKNPLFDNVTVNLDSFDRVRLSINSLSVNTFATNEYVLQSNSGAVGQVVYANSSHIELKAVKGTFSANLKFANGSTANDNVRGLTSNSLANVATSNVIYFTVSSSTEVVSELTTGANAVIASPLSNTQLLLNSVGGRFATSDTIYDPITNAYANVVSIYVSNGTIDVSSIFADNFNQTLRFPLTSNSAPFSQFERVIQEFSNATAMVISANNEQDIVYTGANGSFSVGNIVRNSGNTVTGILTYANATYLRVTSVNGYFATGQTIINNLDIGATISGAHYALVLSDIGGSGLFSTGPNSGNVTGQTTGSTGKSNIINPDSSPAKNVIKYPDLTLNSGEVSYLENISSIFQLSNTSKETVKIVIKF
ncbi:hypothetical protein UFOVP1071_5 [uncultured Caudovirales phage]|uniref:Uncharacterized protein n=1 Tax=uncultured Caudovirales phage TaxID=2100421 RepID=A0A6J5QHU3_9CAUD|nr:hypothetical protein UFOVP1071_5 [uncultured Caudovirales phage]